MPKSAKTASATCSLWPEASLRRQRVAPTPATLRPLKSMATPGAGDRCRQAAGGRGGLLYL